MKRISKLCFLFLFSYSAIHSEPRIDLLESARLGDLEGVKKAISEKADINFKDSLGTSALMFAANNNHFPVVKYLVDNKADVLAKNTNGWTAAVMAGARGNTFIKDYLEDTEKLIVKSGITGIVLSVIGDVFVENRKLKVGDSILENQTVYVMKKSLCELQVKQSLSQFTLRLKELTVFVLKMKEAPEANIFSGVVNQGTVLFKVKKLFSGEEIQAVTPTIVASVRGTVFDVNVAKDGSTIISTYEGSVRTRIRSPETEDNEIIENTPEMKKLVSNLEHNAQNIPSGHSIEVTSEKQKEILKKADAEGLKNRAERKEFSTAPISDLSLKCSERPKIKTVDSKEFSAKQRESEDLVGVDAATLKNTPETPDMVSLIQSRKEDAISKSRMEALKRGETILLKNGRSIKGSSIYQNEKKYIISSDTEQHEINEAEAEKILFE